MIPFFALGACDPAATPAEPTIVHGTGDFVGMVQVPEANVRAGSSSGPLRPPPGQKRLVAPSFACTPAEIASDGCPAVAHDALPARLVRVHSFWIDALEVSNARYGEFLAATGYRPPHVEEEWAEQDWNWEGPQPRPDKATHAVVLTNWYDAREYCAWRGARLPTEAEWQLAALGPADDPWAYPWGKTYAPGRMNRGKMEVPNYDDSDDGFLTTSPVGQYPEGASRYGALDTFGNAWEWVADLRTRNWDEVRFEDEKINLGPFTTPLGLYAGARGFSYFADPRVNLQMDHNAFPVELRRKTSGFRCARDPAPT